MTIASKTVLLDFEYTRWGAPFANVTTRPDIDASEFDFTRRGAPYIGVGNASTPLYPNIAFPTRWGAPFANVTTRPDIDASEFDFTRRGAPFWVSYGGPPPSFNAATFFIMF